MRAAAAKDRPEMADLWFMRLRHTAVVRLAESGVNIPKIAAVTRRGSSSPRRAEPVRSLRGDPAAPGRPGRLSPRAAHPAAGAGAWRRQDALCDDLR